MFNPFDLTTFPKTSEEAELIALQLEYKSLCLEYAVELIELAKARAKAETAKQELLQDIRNSQRGQH